MKKHTNASQPSAAKGKISLAFCWNLPDGDLEESMSRLRQYGFDGIELWPAALQSQPLEKWGAALRNQGMKCFQLCPYFNLIEGPEKIEESRRLLDEFLTAARALNCGRIRVFTGPLGEKSTGAREATEKQWNAAISSLREFCDIAAPQQAELCLECHEGSLMEDGPSALRLIESVNRPNLTANLQLPLRNEPWTESLRLLAPHTTHIHIHNWEEGMGLGHPTFLADGAFDWLPVVNCIAREHGRDLCLSVEHSDHGGRDQPWETARRDGPFLVELRRKAAGDSSA